ncbi:hypothetical protein C9F11_37525 [Streptomyces sp. YIM 121038]|uniref:hypothetical protein n=1 Tax=Streptomyces sp. YIM 121038 TaxID=2136401 RepID=UPI00111009B8|nr:hypothetical protein [Streptomyces sp. YIM 121038]QCX81088.1 hypothetical protein C9F11_37525 [Streptomyces sp. YIM 121038]
MTSPTDEIRTAAATLRALATAASTATSAPLDRGGKPTTRWHFAERPGFGSGYLYAENPNGPGARLTHGTGRDGHPGMRTRHGQYAAAMDPTVGLALADWLDLEADVIAGRIAQDGTDEHAVAIDGDHALAVARAILGSQP